MERLVVKPSKVSGSVKAQPSKSYTHRALSIALLADGESFIVDPLRSLDTRATLNAVQILGGKMKGVNRGWKVEGVGGKPSPRKKVMNVGNSGTTLRLMSAISSLSQKPVRLTGDDSILERPMGPLIDSLSDLGADARCEGPGGRPPVVVGGGLVGGETSITGEMSSQFISALLIVTPHSEVGVDLEVEGQLRSKPYIRMTLRVLNLAGANVRSQPSLMNYSVPGEQSFRPFEFSVPGDFSSAAFPLVAGALSDEWVEVTNLESKEVQGDKRIIDFLRDFGVDVKVGENSVRVRSSGELQAIDADCSDTPDLVPALSVLGAVADGQTRLHNISHLRYKEVDRLKALKKELSKMGVKVKELEDGLKIFGTNRLSGGELESYGDHRMAMTLAVAGLVAEGGVRVNNAESVRVSYPSFVDDMRKLGVDVSVEK